MLRIRLVPRPLPLALALLCAAVALVLPAAVPASAQAAPFAAFPSAGATVPPTFETYGSGNAGGTIELRDGDTLLGSVVEDGNGSWSFTTNVPMTPGEHQLAFSETIGGSTAVFASPTVQVQPYGPVLDGPSAYGDVDAGDIHVTGTATPGASIRIELLTGPGYRTVTPFATGTADEDGHFDVVGTRTTYGWARLQGYQSVGGVESAVSGWLQFRVVPPGTPTIGVAGDVEAVKTGADVVLHGTATYDGGVHLGLVLFSPDGEDDDVVIQPDGTWTATFTARSGFNSYQVMQTIDGEWSRQSPQLTVAGVDVPGLSAPTEGERFTTPQIPMEGTDQGAFGEYATIVVRDGDDVVGTVDDRSGSWSLTTSALAPGAHTLQVTQTFRGGESDPVTVHVDIAPPPPTLTHPDPSDALTEFTAGTFHFTGTATPGADVTVSTTCCGDQFDPVTGTADVLGHFDVAVTVRSGTYYAVLTQTVDGASSDATSSLWLVASAPDPTVALAPHDGPYLSGDTVDLTGTGNPGSSLELRVNSSVKGSVTVGDDGTWTGSVTIGDGDNFIEAQQDGAAISGDVYVEGLYAPHVSAPQEGDAVPPTFTLRGDGYEGTIAVADGDEPLGTVDVEDCGCWTFTPDAPLSAGPHTITLTQVHEGVTLTRTLHVTVDPTALVVDAPQDGADVPPGETHFTGSGKPGATVNVHGAADDPIGTGTVGEDGRFDVTATLDEPGPNHITVTQTIDDVESPSVSLTIDVALAPPTLVVAEPSTVLEGATLHLSGIAASGAHVAVSVNDVPITSAEADADGAWSATVDAAYWDNYITVLQTTGDNQSFDSAAAHVVGVGAPTVYDPSDDDVVSATFAVAGAAVPNGTIVVADEHGATLGTATPDADNGAWSVDATTALAPGTHTLHVHQELNGVTGPDRTLTVHVRPAAPTLTTPATGTSPVAVTGVGTPGAEIAVYAEDGDTPLATGSVGDDGTFSVPTTLEPGDRALAVTQTVAGTESARASLHVLVMLAPPTLALSGPSTVKAGDDVTVGGTAVAGATITVYRNDEIAATAQAGGDGSWSASVTVGADDNFLTAAQEHGADTSLASDAVYVAGVGAPVIGFPADGDTVDGPTVGVSGSARPGATVAVADERGTSVGSTVADEDGRWSVTTSALVGGDRVLHVRQTASLVQSDEATLALTVRIAPAVTQGPVPTAVDAGDSATFTAAASGYPAPSVRWQRSRDDGATWGDIPGATDTTYSFTAAGGDDGARFRAIFTNPAGDATTDAATLSVTTPSGPGPDTTTTTTTPDPGPPTTTPDPGPTTTTPDPDPPTTTTTPGPPATITPPKPLALSIAAPVRPTVARLKTRAGIKVAVTVPGAGRLRLTLVAGRGRHARTLAIGTVTVRAAGRRSVALKVRKGEAKRLKRGSYRLVARLQPKAGKAKQASRTIRLR